MNFYKRVLGHSAILIAALLIGTASSAQETTADSTAVVQETAVTVGSSSGLPTDATIIGEGKSLFNNICSQCHEVANKKVGPALANVWERREIPWLLNFIKYPQKVIDSGDEYAANLYAEYKSAGYMPNHDFLSDDEILSILAYVQEETLNPAVAVVASGTSVSGEAGTSGGANSTLLLAIVGGLVVLLLVLVVTLFLLASVLTKYLGKDEKLTEEDKAFINQKFSIGAVIKSPMFLGIITFIFLAVAAKATVDGLFSIGVQQGYAPEQPITFSHKLHAGYYEIDCKYCHTGVEKSKSANIPSANICMNCHNSIRQESPEIQKIYAAIENNEPIQWVRVHNLPDLAYFNHAQHVKVGGLECENCHGEIKEMEVVQQHSLLTMGWCIDCHRQTEVNTKDNGYYTRLVELHSETSKEPMKVEDIGGLECAKCHY